MALLSAYAKRYRLLTSSSPTEVSETFSSICRQTKRGLNLQIICRSTTANAIEVMIESITHATIDIHPSWRPIRPRWETRVNKDFTVTKRS